MTLNRKRNRNKFVEQRSRESPILENSSDNEDQWMGSDGDLDIDVDGDFHSDFVDTEHLSKK